MISEASASPTPEPSTSEVAGRLRMAVTRLHRLMRQQSDLGLTPTKLAHLATIVREGPMSLGDVAAAERVAAPTVTKVVKELERIGLVERAVDAADRRVVIVSGTPRGRLLIEETRSRKDVWLSERLAELPREDLERVNAAISVLEHLTVPPPG